MADGGECIGLTVAKIDGIFELDVTNARWKGSRTVTQHHTGGGSRNAESQTAPSCTFDEVVAKDGRTDWKNKKNFRIDIYDKETKKKLIFSMSGASWESLDGNADTQSASTKRSISCKGTQLNGI